MSADPIRIQLSRVRGWRMPPNTVKVSRPGPWGNPFVIGSLGVPDAATAVSKFEALIADEVRCLQHDRFFMFTGGRIALLRGKNLACWCKEGPCHADVLLRIANAGPST